MKYQLTPTPDDITQVSEVELREKLPTFIDRVAFAEDELLITRGGQPAAAVISMEGWRALRRVAEDVVEKLLGDERLRALVGEDRSCRPMWSARSSPCQASSR